MRPRRIKIGHTKYQVRWSKAAVDELAQDKVSGGACSLRKKTIAVEPLRDNHAAEAEVLLHEVLHAAIWGTSLPIGRDQEERVVATLAPVLLMTLRENPTLVAYLTATVNTR